MGKHYFMATKCHCKLSTESLPPADACTEHHADDRVSVQKVLLLGFAATLQA